MHPPIDSKEVAWVCTTCLDKQQMKKDVGSVRVGAFGDIRVSGPVSVRAVTPGSSSGSSLWCSEFGIPFIRPAWSERSERR